MLLQFLWTSISVNIMYFSNYIILNQNAEKTFLSELSGLMRKIIQHTKKFNYGGLKND